MKSILQLTKTARDSLTSSSAESSNNTSMLLPIIGTAAVAAASVGISLYYVHHNRKVSSRNNLRGRQHVAINAENTNMELASYQTTHEEISEGRTTAALEKLVFPLYDVNALRNFVRSMRTGIDEKYTDIFITAMQISDQYRYNACANNSSGATSSEPSRDTVSRTEYENAIRIIARLSNQIAADKPIVEAFYNLAAWFGDIGNNDDPREFITQMVLRCLLQNACKVPVVNEEPNYGARQTNLSILENNVEVLVNELHRNMTTA